MSGWERRLVGEIRSLACLHSKSVYSFLSFPSDSQAFPVLLLGLNQIIKIQGRFDFLLQKDVKVGRMKIVQEAFL